MAIIMLYRGEAQQQVFVLAKIAIYIFQTFVDINNNKIKEQAASLA